MTETIIIQPIPIQIAYENRPYGSLNLGRFIHSQLNLSFQVRCQINDQIVPLPKGLTCTESGELKGIPEAETAGHYTIFVITKNSTSDPIETSFLLMIQPDKLELINDSKIEPLSTEQHKSQIWQALETEHPLPDFFSVEQLPITITEMYYLLERFSPLIVWNMADLTAPSMKKQLSLPGTNSHFHIYDRGSCLVATPKNLYSHERTLRDSIQTAQVVAEEVYKRSWNIEFSGFEKVVRALWVKIQELNNTHGQKVTISNFEPSSKERRIYREQVQNHALKRLLEN